MSNREGEFELRIEPGNEDNLVRTDHYATIIARLTQTIELGAELLDPEFRGPVVVYNTASPEFGSVVFALLAATVPNALAVAANASQLIGINIREIFNGLSLVLMRRQSPNQGGSVQGIANNTEFVAAVTKLTAAAGQSGYASVRVSTPDGLTIELVPPLPKVGADIVAELRRVELEIELSKLRNPRLYVRAGSKKLSDRMAQAERALRQELEARRAVLQTQLIEAEQAYQRHISRH